ncbi:MAG: zinc ribbon domain-containing protein [Candidatus Pararuminococcus gallinarum]|jgi:hypothetical protein|uniref:zinc ribbon domain-containing protein n=1 Tax=Zongyangia sp. HA2173 TaxID=3133035 RepID=UPI00315F89E1
MPFCGKCGAPLDGGKFCPNCGAKTESTPLVAGGAAAINSPKKTGGKRRMAIIAAVIAAIAIAVILGAFLLPGRSYESTVEKFVDAQFSADMESAINLMPKKFIDYQMEQDGYDSDDFDEVVDDLNGQIQDQLDSFDQHLGEGWKISHEIVDAGEIDREELERTKDAYADIGIKVSAAKTAEVEITITADETEVSNTLEIPLVKVGRSWYLDGMRIGNLI